MSVYYYLTVFPLEAMIASMLPPEEFGSYMAVGSQKGTAEQMMFFEVTESSSYGFDWDYANTRTVPHADGRPKNSVYLSVYRALEQIPISSLGKLYLTTEDGRTLALESSEYEPPEGVDGIFLYKELCPIHPIVVSVLPPKEFADFITQGGIKIAIPKIVFTDLKPMDPSGRGYTGNIGPLYDRNRKHLETCIREVREKPHKKSKIFDRSHAEKFTYQAVNRGIYLADHEHFIMYRMKTEEELEQNHYEWGLSAQIL